jgi:hypothetical protein
MQRDHSALLARIAELSSMINKASAAKKPKTANKVYERPVAVAIVNEILPVAAAAPPPPPVPVSRFDKKTKRFQNKVWRKSSASASESSLLSPRPPPVRLRKKMKERLKKPASAGKNRVAVFREEGSFRKMRPNMLARTESVMSKTMSLKVPKVKQRPVCTFFLRGECHKDDCEFSHVNVGPDAPVCEDFQNGYCDLGERCPKRHVSKKKAERKRKKDDNGEEEKAEKGSNDFDDNEEFIKL